jgi:hypothetical protein
MDTSAFTKASFDLTAGRDRIDARILSLQRKMNYPNSMSPKGSRPTWNLQSRIMPSIADWSKNGKGGFKISPLGFAPQFHAGKLA